MSATITLTFSVETFHAPMVMDRLEKLVKKALRAGINPPIITNTREWVTSIDEGDDSLGFPLPLKMIPMTEYTIQVDIGIFNQ